MTKLLIGCALGVLAMGPALADETESRPFNGFSFGIHGGGLTTDYFGEHNLGDPVDELSFKDLDDVQPLVGFQFGYDRHIADRLVVGLHIDMSFAFGESEGPTSPGGDRLTAETDYLATAGLQLGYMALQDTLLFGRGGLAFVNYDATVTDAGSGTTADVGEGNAGVFAAGGIRYRLTEDVSVLGEGVYYFFDDENDTDGVTPDSNPGDRFGIDGTTLFRLGVSYQF